MYVYLTSDGSSIFISMTSEPAGCYIAPGWKLYMAIETPLDTCFVILHKWKKESYSLVKCIRRGFELSKRFNVPVHVSTIPVGDLKKISAYPETKSKIKNVPDDFWINL